MSPQSNPSARIGYNGQLQEPGCYWQFLGNGYRVYNPVLMRFHSPDSLSPFDEGGINSYAYCSCDPVNNVDPTGQFLVPVAALMGVGAVGMGALALGSSVSGDGKSAAIFGAIAGAMGSAAMVLGAVHALGPPRGALVPNKNLGMGEAMIWRGPEYDRVRLHGLPFASGWKGRAVPAKELAGEIKKIGGGAVLPKRIELQSCYGGYGGDASQAQTLANELGVKVEAYTGQVWLSAGVKHVNRYEGPALLFAPQTGATRRASAIRNQKMHSRFARHAAGGPAPR
jgi:RHS repeat-associated protein